ncbi:MAG: hypothetical protein A2486_02650 [Burkholderiales bacterium RIFOXYC12_FULL_65_23]|nr:MAG: hypothetical protein A2486_02650 [Burkholderiales bacterium RIFOXYC12_FULL_65_23]
MEQGVLGHIGINQRLESFRTGTTTGAQFLVDESVGSEAGLLGFLGGWLGRLGCVGGFGRRGGRGKGRRRGLGDGFERQGRNGRGFLLQGEDGSHGGFTEGTVSYD